MSNTENKENTEPTLDNPKLSLFTKIFIVVGIVALAAMSWIYYDMHKNDPEYTRTKIDPDSTLAEQFDVKFDTVKVDTAKAKAQEAEEKKAAEKVLNSIRKTVTPEEPTEEPATTDAPTTSSDAPTATPPAENSEPTVEVLE